MKFLAFLIPSVAAFSVAPVSIRNSEVTALNAVDRRAAVAGCFASVFGGQHAAHAFSQHLDDYAIEPSQQATDGKIDLNGAFVVSWNKYPVKEATCVWRKLTTFRVS